MKFFQNSIFFFIFIALFGCKEPKNDQPFLAVSPDDLSIQAYENEKLVFTINIISDHIVTNFVVTKKFEGENETVILDSTINLKNISFQWAFWPSVADAQEDLILYFKAINDNGYQSVVGRRLKFYGKKFEESTGLKIYSANSGTSAAFNLITLQPVALSADSLQRDVQEFQSDTSFTHLSKKWISPSGCKFVKFNDYDYGNASSSTAKSAFEAGIQLTEVANIETGDVFIVKITRQAPSEVFAVIKVTDLIDPEGKANDFYEISVKK